MYGASGIKKNPAMQIYGGTSWKFSPGSKDSGRLTFIFLCSSYYLPGNEGRPQKEGYYQGADRQQCMVISKSWMPYGFMSLAGLLDKRLCFVTVTPPGPGPYQKGGWGLSTTRSSLLIRPASSQADPEKKDEPAGALDLKGVGAIMNVFGGLPLRGGGRDGFCSVTGQGLRRWLSLS